MSYLFPLGMMGFCPILLFLEFPCFVAMLHALLPLHFLYFFPFQNLQKPKGICFCCQLHSRRIHSHSFLSLFLSWFHLRSKCQKFSVVTSCCIFPLTC